MKILCACGQLISDSTDYLSYKAHLIADQDYFDLIEAICEQAARAATIAPEGEDRSGKDRAKMMANIEFSIYETFRRYAAQTIYQCPACGRLHVDSRLDTSQLHQFVPGDDSVPRDLLRSAQKPYEKRPRPEE